MRMHKTSSQRAGWWRFHDDSFDLVDAFEVFVPGQQSPPGFHAACGNPDVIDWDPFPFLHEGVVYDPVFPCDVLINGDNFHLELIDDLEKLSFVEVPPRPFHEPVTELAQDNGWHKQMLTRGCQ